MPAPPLKLENFGGFFCFGAMEYARNIRAFRQQLTEKLTQLYEPSEAHELARRLASHFSGIAEQWLSLEPDAEFDVQAYEDVVSSAERLLSGTPLQYITGWAHFYGRDFKVTPDTLIPRRETEELLVWIRDAWKEKATKNRPIHVLDIGTGTGCIPISLDLEWKEKGISSKQSGIDINENTITVARENAHLLGSDVHFRKIDILKAQKLDFSGLDIVVSNPPYVTESEKPFLHTNVLDHEPHLALFVPDEDPLIFYRKISQLAMDWLRSGGELYLEINEQFGHEVCQLLESKNWQDIILRTDLQGKDRMIKACK